MSKHTAGPWEYRSTEGSEHELCTVYIKNGKAIARHVRLENAPLIAAAPDLLEACKHVLSQLQQTDFTGTKSEKMLIAAITKAGGA